MKCCVDRLRSQSGHYPLFQSSRFARYHSSQSFGVFMRRCDFITIFGAAGILISQSPVFAQTFRTYNCYDGSQFILAFFEGDKRAHLQLDGKAVTLPKRISLSGSRYAKGDISLRITKTVITLKRGKQSTECITRSWLGSLLPTR